MIGRIVFQILFLKFKRTVAKVFQIYKKRMTNIYKSMMIMQQSINKIFFLKEGNTFRNYQQSAIF